MFPICFKAECKTHVKYNPNFVFKNYACVKKKPMHVCVYVCKYTYI